MSLNEVLEKTEPEIKNLEKTMIVEVVEKTNKKVKERERQHEFVADIVVSQMNTDPKIKELIIRNRALLTLYVGDLMREIIGSELLISEIDRVIGLVCDKYNFPE